jgi:hypothetical protein
MPVRRHRNPPAAAAGGGAAQRIIISRSCGGMTLTESTLTARLTL